MTLDLQSLALILVAGLVFGQPLAWLLRISALNRAGHTLVTALGRKLNRERRTIATRAGRGFIVPLMLITLAAIAGALLDMLPRWLLQAGAPAAFASLPAYAVLAAMLTPQRFLLPLKRATQDAVAERWGSIDTPLKTLAGGYVHAPDGHGRARYACMFGIHLFVHQCVGSIIALTVAGPIGLCVYRMVQLCALHYDGRIQSLRGFHWASEKLGILAAIPATFVAGLLLVLTGQAMAGIQPLRGLVRMVRAKQGVSLAAWLAHSTGVTLDGPVTWYGYERPAAWVGSGTARITGQHLSRCWWWLLVASVLMTVMLAGLAANFQPSDFDMFFNLIPAEIPAFLS